MGNASEAGQGLNHALGLSREELPGLLKKTEHAIIDEFNTHGSDDDKANLKYILEGTACENLPNHVKLQIRKGEYHGGKLANGEFDAGHKGMRFEDFMKHKHCQTAKLVRSHVLALRLYTSSSYPCFNNHLRKNTKTSHPFKMSVYYLNEAIKLLRFVAAEEFPDYFEEVSLWRGMRDMAIMEEFMKKGGTEMAPMFTSRDQTVAFKYPASQTPLVFHYRAKALMQGVSIEFLSLYPKEKEYLYPPLTYLSPLGRDEEVHDGKIYHVLIVTPQIST